MENPLDGFSFFVLSSRHIQSRSSESSPHAEIAGGNILSERKRSISFADSRLGLQSFSNNRRSPDGMLLFSEIDFVFQRQFPKLKNQTDSQILLSDRRFMQKQTLLGRANRVRDKPEFYPVGSRHFVRLFSTYPSDTSVGRRLVGGEKSHAIKQF